jgi:hypothetical protein
MTRMCSSYIVRSTPQHIGLSWLLLVRTNNWSILQRFSQSVLLETLSSGEDRLRTSPKS